MSVTMTLRSVAVNVESLVVPRHVAEVGVAKVGAVEAEVVRDLGPIVVIGTVGLQAHIRNGIVSSHLNHIIVVVIIITIVPGINALIGGLRARGGISDLEIGKLGLISITSITNQRNGIL